MTISRVPCWVLLINHSRELQPPPADFQARLCAGSYTGLRQRCACRPRRIALSALSDNHRPNDGYCPNDAVLSQRSETSDALSSAAVHGSIRRARHTLSASANQGDLMNKDQVKGRVEEAKGKIKEVTGRTVGNPDLEDRGTAQKVGGAIQKDYGDLKEDVKDSLKKPR
jgi:uncharacterized protein YjbJ (UPF0337 family)